MKLRRKTLLSVLALVVAAAGGAGIARSTSTEPIPDANGVIHACYKKPIGPARIVFSAANCWGGEQSIQWSQSGGSGVETYARSPAVAVGLSGANDAVHEIVSVELPAGNYVVTAAGSFANGSSPNIVTCLILNGAERLHRSLSSLESSGEFGHTTVLGVVELNSPATIAVGCESFEPATLLANWRLVAQQVGALK
jgi:hypothetical protein